MGVKFFFDSNNIMYFIHREDALVDGEPWHTVSLTIDAAAWFRSTYAGEENRTWHEHIDQRGYINQYLIDMNDQLYTALVLRWS